MFIVLEGIDACGKSTQMELLREKLSAKTFSFPDYELPLGKIILANLHSEWECVPKDSVDYTPEYTNLLNAAVFQALHTVNKLEHAEEISDLLAEGRHVIVDRYWQSSMVYGVADGLDKEWLLKVNVALPQPTHSILVDIPPELSESRRPKGRDRYELQEGLMATARSSYKELWATAQDEELSPGTWSIVDGSLPVAEVQEQILSIIR